MTLAIFWTAYFVIGTLAAIGYRAFVHEWKFDEFNALLIVFFWPFAGFFWFIGFGLWAMIGWFLKMIGRVGGSIRTNVLRKPY